MSSMPDRIISKLEWEVERIKEEQKELERSHKEMASDLSKNLKEVNDRLDRIILVLLAALFSLIIFFFGVAAALLTGQL
jgi:hypothetical protein